MASTVGSNLVSTLFGMQTVRSSGGYDLIIDIDERKRAEEAAAASERDLTLIVDTIPVARLVGATRWQRRFLQPALSGLCRPVSRTGARMGAGPLPCTLMI